MHPHLLTPGDFNGRLRDHAYDLGDAFAYATISMKRFTEVWSPWMFGNLREEEAKAEMKTQAIVFAVSFAILYASGFATMLLLAF